VFIMLTHPVKVFSVIWRVSFIVTIVRVNRWFFKVGFARSVSKVRREQNCIVNLWNVFPNLFVCKNRIRLCYSTRGS